MRDRWGTCVDGKVLKQRLSDGGRPKKSDQSRLNPTQIQIPRTLQSKGEGRDTLPAKNEG